LLAEFEDGHALAAAARRLRASGYRRLDAHTPYPVIEVEEALALPGTRLGWVVFAAAMLGAAGGYAMQWYLMVIDYPINVGGRPLHSWPAFVPITFEVMVLTASIGGVVALFARNGLPRPHHPVLAALHLDRVTGGGFFLAVEAGDAAFDAPWTRRLLGRLGATEVTDVPDA
jgi:hypothetical protein